MEEENLSNENIIKIVLKYTAAISIFSGILSIVTSSLYNFGYFLYFLKTINSFPISTYEIMKESLVFFPLMFFLIPLFGLPGLPGIVVIFGRFPLKKNNKSNNPISSISKTKNNSKNYLIIKIIMLLFYTSILSILTFLIALTGFWFCTVTSLAIFVIILIFDCINKKYSLEKQIILFCAFTIHIIILSISLGYSKAIFDDKIIQSSKQEYIEMNDGTIINNIKIIKSYEKGILVLDENKSLTFFLFHNIKKYSFKTKRFIYLECVTKWLEKDVKESIKPTIFSYGIINYED